MQVIFQLALNIQRKKQEMKEEENSDESEKSCSENEGEECSVCDESSSEDGELHHDVEMNMWC